MRYGIFIGICLFLIILQTAILPYFNVLSDIYNLLIPFVIFICIYLPLRESLPFVLILGMVMDNLSGSPFGLYLTFYFWLLLGVRWVITFLRVGNKFLLSSVTVVAVLLENILIIGTFALSGPGWQLPADVFKKIALQFFWALATAPIFLFCLQAFLKRFGIQLNGAAHQAP